MKRNGHLTFQCVINKVRGFLQRNLEKCSHDVKASCYLMLIRPILEYACVVWSPYHQCNVHAIEMVQRHATWYVLNKFDRYASLLDMITLVGWPTLESRHYTLTTLMMYKIMNNLVNVPTNTILLPSTLQLHYKTAYWEITTVTLQSQCLILFLFSQAIKLWSNLPQHLISLPDFQNFKETL